MAMTTRKKSNHLKKLGFQKAPFQLTRVGHTYRRGNTSVTIAKGDKGGGNFIAVTPGQGSFNSSLLYIGNTSESMKQVIRHYRNSGVDLPDPDAADFGTPDWSDRLFVGFTEALQ
jgi:hypothetical protein